MNSTNESNAPTAAQMSTLADLAKRGGYESVPQMAMAFEMAEPQCKATASRLLSAVIGPQAKTGGQAGTRQQYATARQLRRMAEGETDIPDTLDADAVWVLERLAALKAVQGLLGEPRAKPPVNGEGPILVKHLVDHFGSVELVAQAFSLSAATVKAWGTAVPNNRWYEAQVRTGGKVCVPGI